MKYNVRPIYAKDGSQVGAWISLIGIARPTTAWEKFQLEEYLVHHAFDVVFKGQSLLIFREYHDDIPSIVVLNKHEKL